MPGAERPARRGESQGASPAGRDARGSWSAQRPRWYPAAGRPRRLSRRPTGHTRRAEAGRGRGGSCALTLPCTSQGARVVPAGRLRGLGGVQVPVLHRQARWEARPARLAVATVASARYSVAQSKDCNLASPPATFAPPWVIPITAASCRGELRWGFDSL